MYTFPCGQNIYQTAVNERAVPVLFAQWLITRCLRISSERISFFSDRFIPANKKYEKSLVTNHILTFYRNYSYVGQVALTTRSSSSVTQSARFEHRAPGSKQTLTVLPVHNVQKFANPSMFIFLVDESINQEDKIGCVTRNNDKRSSGIWSGGSCLTWKFRVLSFSKPQRIDLQFRQASLLLNVNFASALWNYERGLLLKMSNHIIAVISSKSLVFRQKWPMTKEC